MTIIHVIEPFASGVTTAVINITNQLPDYQHIIVHGSRLWVDKMENVRSKFPPYVRFIEWSYADREINPFKDFLALMSLKKILKQYNNAVVHLHSSKAGFLGRLACRSLGIKKVLYTPHCPAFIRTDVSNRKRCIYRNLEKFGNSLGGKIIGCGESEARLFKDMGINAEWVSNGVDPGESVRGKEPNPRNVTFVGIANEQKNPALFNSIAENFRQKDIPFLWVGDGTLKDKLTSNNISVTGWVEKKEIDLYLSKTLVYLSTSGWEGLPFGGLEAMNASCALLLKDVPGNRDLVESGRNGFLFTNKEEAVKKLTQMLNDPLKTMEMGVNSRRIVSERFSLKQMGEKYRTIYRSMTS